MERWLFAARIRAFMERKIASDAEAAREGGGERAGGSGVVRARA